MTSGKEPMREERVELAEPLANREGALRSRGAASPERAQQGWLSGSRRKGCPRKALWPRLPAHAPPQGAWGLPAAACGAGPAPLPRAAPGPGRTACVSVCLCACVPVCLSGGVRLLASPPGHRGTVGARERALPTRACGSSRRRNTASEGLRGTRGQRVDQPPRVGKVKQWLQQCLSSTLCKSFPTCSYRLSQLLLWSWLGGGAQQAACFLRDASLGHGFTVPVAGTAPPDLALSQENSNG